MKSLSLVLAFAAAVSCDPYTIGQVASGYTHGGLITGVDYGNGVVSGVGAIGNRGVVYSGLHGVGVHHFGKREAEPWTVGQVAAGVPLVNAALDGRLHNPGVITHVSHGIHGYSGLGYYGKRDADADAYTLGQVYAGLPIHNAYATGHPHNVGVITGVSHGYYYGKRDAEAQPYTLGQVYGGLPLHNAYATGHAHNPGYISHVSYPSVYHYGK